MDYDFADELRGPDREGNRVMAFFGWIAAALLLAAGLWLGGALA